MQYLLDPQNALYSIFGQPDDLEAFCSFGPDGQVSGWDYSTTALDIGLGLRPDLTGRGYGSEYVNAVINFALSTYSPEQLRVTIAAFNRRALRVWEKASFQVVQKFKGGWEHIDFVILMKNMP